MSTYEFFGPYPENDFRFYLRHDDMKYGLPEKKKYPMPDRNHVMSAIKFFNYVSPVDEKELARNIIARIKEYGIKDINVGENNRFGKYYKPGNEYLMHHGILKQKWGVRHGPPYPLDYSKHSEAQKEANANKHNIGQTQNNVDTKQGSVALALAGGGLFAFNMAVIYIPKELKNYKVKKALKQVISKRNGEIDETTGFQKRTENDSVEKDIKNVNPMFNVMQDAQIANNNCVMCSMAFEMRRRGYDVAALGSRDGTNGLAATKKIFKGAKVENVDPFGITIGLKENTIIHFKDNSKAGKRKTAEVIISARRGQNEEFAKSFTSEISKTKNSRGSVFVYWGSGGGHAMSYEVKGGKLTLYDSQIGKIYKEKSQIDSIFKHCWSGQYIRLDNLNAIDTKGIKKYVA